MKALTASDLQSILDSELVWRRKEISSLITLTKTVPEAARVALVRAAVPLLYAHWEGFGRECIVRYLEFVSYRRIKFKNLVPSFLYLSSLGSLTGIGEKSAREGIAAIDGFIARGEATNKDAFRKRVTTKSNLRSEVLEELLTICGLSATEFEEHADFIDREICDSRNEIAHGSGAAPGLNIFIQRRDRAFAIMAQLQATVTNAAAMQGYKRAA
jgi:hypothetical protein